jgi:hypothetical protein
VSKSILPSRNSIQRLFETCDKQELNGLEKLCYPLRYHNPIPK